MHKYIFNIVFQVMAVFMTALSLCGCAKDAVIGFEGGEMAGEAVDAAIPDTEEKIDNNDAAEEDSANICVFVCGAVMDPGVVELPAGSRVADALEKAGGFTEFADKSYVNLASVLTDGQKVYFPEEGEAVYECSGDEQSGQSGDGRININTADKDLLCSLPGIGDAKAEAIIVYREENGSFSDPEDIMNVSGIGESLYEKIRDLICAD